jgi:hypothetical protein
MTHFPEKIYDMRANNSGLHRVAVIWCNACCKSWGEGSWVTGMEGYKAAHADMPSAASERHDAQIENDAVGGF